MKLNPKLCSICCNELDSYSKVIYKDSRHKYVVCGACGFVCQNPGYNKEYYKNLGYDTQHNYIEHAMNRAKYIFNFIQYNLMITNYKRDTIDILDIGCGRGGVLYYLGISMKHFYNNVHLDAITLHEDDYNNKHHSINMSVLDIEDEIDVFVKTQPTRKYDLIIMSHVLEHLHDPGKALRQIKEKLLEPFGQIYIEVPSFYRVEVRAKKVFVPVHISYFTETSLNNLLLLCGFKTIKVKDSNWWGNIKCLVTKIQDDYVYDHFRTEHLVKTKYYLYKIINLFYESISKFKHIESND